MIYELFDSTLTLIATADDFIAPRGPDAVSLAKAHIAAGRGPCVIVRDGWPLAAYGDKPALMLDKARRALMPGADRGAAC